MTTASESGPGRALFLGGMLLFAGFVVGFLAGRESARHDAAGPGAAPHLHDGEAPAERNGPHTFTGNIQVPPHGPEGHEAAATLLAGAACPCGGCGGEPLLTCGCDRAKEVEGLAAHLLERGKPASEVMATLVAQYGLVAPAGSSAAPAGESDLERLSDLMNRPPAVTGPADVPTGARKTSPAGRN